MDLEKLQKLARLVLERLGSYNQGYYIRSNTELAARVRNLFIVSDKSLPEHHEFFQTVYNAIFATYSALSVSDARSAIMHLLTILEIEKASESKIKKMRIFESADEKMKQAALSFRKDDYPSTFHNLNTVLELVLKDKVEYL